MYQKIYKESKKAKELKDISEEERYRNVSIMLHRHLFAIKATEFKHKEPTIQKWIKKDKEKQDKYNNAQPPKHYCPDCDVKMKSTMKTLDITRDDDVLKVLFFMECSHCKKREGIYDDGEIRKSEPFLCPECGKEADYTREEKGKVIKWITKCKSCDYKKEEIDDYEEWKKKWNEEKKKDKELLEKYREQYCLSDKEGKEYVETIEAMEVAAVVKEEEIQKYDTQAYAESLKLKKTNIPDLEKMLTKAIYKAGYEKLDFEKPEIGQFINISFSVQDPNSERTARKSTNELEETIKKTLNDTNWRLTSGVSYRLGYLQGRLKGYEQEEDLVKLVEKQKPTKKPQDKVDPEMYQKYAHHNFVQLAKMMGKHEAIRNIRNRRLEKEPEGFFLEASEGTLNCGICNRSFPCHKIWWTLDTQYCADCWNNIQKGNIPKGIKGRWHNEGQWISEWQIKDRHGVHPATRGKYVRNGFLKARQLTDDNETIYCTVFLVDENNDFLKKHPEIEKENPKINASSSNN